MVLRNGPAAAAVLAAAFGCAVVGVATVAAAIAPSLELALASRFPTRIASGPALLALAAWITSWLALGYRWRHHDVDFARVTKLALVLLALGILGSLPLPLLGLGR
ncbi:MAG: hypothetical protein U1E76_17430 [Planctomycetota bacterium]